MLANKMKIGMAALLSGILVTGMGLPATATLAKETPSRVEAHDDPLPPGAIFRFGSVKLRHLDGIYNSALSADGKLLATASPHCVMVWDLTTEKRLWRFRFEDDGTFATPGIAFSPDGKYLGYVHNSDLAYLWSAKSGQEIARFCGRGRHRLAICQFTPDGLFVLDDEKHLLFWDPQKNRAAQSKSIEHLNLLSPDCKTWAFADERSTIRFGDVQTGKETSRLSLSVTNDGMANGVAFSADGKTLAVVHQHREIQIHDFPSGKLRFSFPVPPSPYANRLGEEPLQYRVSFSSDSKMLFLTTYYGTIHRWDLKTGKAMPALQGHIGAAASVHTMPDGRTIVTTGADGLIRRWDSQRGKELTKLDGYVGRIHTAYSPDGRFAAVGDERGRLDFWDAHSGRRLRVLQQKGPAVSGLVFSPDSRSLAGSSMGESPEDNIVQIWDAASGAKQRTFSSEMRPGWTLTFSPDSRRLLTAGCQFPQLFEVSTGKVCWQASYYFGPSTFSRDGKTLYVSSGPYLLFLDAATGKTRFRVHLKDAPEHMGIVTAITICPDDQRLALGLHTGEVLLCDASTGSELMRFRAVDRPKRVRFNVRLNGAMNQGTVWGISFSPDGKWISSAATDGSVRLWEAISGQQVLRLKGHEGYADEVSFGPEGRTVLTSGADAQAYLWSLRPPIEQGTKPSLDSLWADLAAEPAKAYGAVWSMSEIKEAAAFLRGKLAPVKLVADERLGKLIDDLESDTYAVREKATKALADFGRVAALAMREALRNKPPLETRKRLEDLLQRIDKKPRLTEELRQMRAIDMLERQGTAEARELLQRLAAGAPGAIMTTEAQAALKRLRRK
jgi:WD40 repeat protein